MLGFALCASVALPWFSLPLFGWSVPTPAWNALGLGLLMLGGLHILRALNLPGVSWAIRLLLPWTLHRWWGSEELFRQWGKRTFAPVQLKLTDVNETLQTIGAAQVSIFDPVQWRDVQPGLGWKLAGISLAVALVVTLIDWPLRSKCPACRARVTPEDPFCHGCGRRFPDVPGCEGCGAKPRSGDRFCRTCGRPSGPTSSDLPALLPEG